MAQLNFPISPNRFITVTYQSNDYLNRELDNKVKQNIAEILIEVADVKKIHSYVHGQIIIEIPSNNSVGTLKKVVEALSKPMASLAPPCYILLIWLQIQEVIRTGYMLTEIVK